MRRLAYWTLAVNLALTSCQVREYPEVDWVAPEDRFVEVNGAKLHYLDWGGEGSLLLFVPGLTNTAYAFTRVAPAFTDRYRVMALTRRGHGSSDPAPTSFGVDLNVDDLAAFISLFSKAPAVVAGMSHGGLEIPRLARRYPERVQALVFLDAVYDWRRLAGYPPLPGFQLDTVYASYSELDEEHRQQFAEFAGEASLRQLHSQVFTRADGRVVWQLPPNEPAFSRYVGLWSEWDPTDYEAIHVPVLVIRAWQEEYLAESLTRRGAAASDLEAARIWARDYDDLAKAQGLELLAAAVPDLEIVNLRATHHLVHFHRPREVIDAMTAFLAEQGGD